jgi:hypothetical protein
MTCDRSSNYTLGFTALSGHQILSAFNLISTYETDCNLAMLLLLYTTSAVFSVNNLHVVFVVVTA